MGNVIEAVAVLLRAPPPPEEPNRECECWREIDWNSRDELLDRTVNYEPAVDNADVTAVNILMVGDVGPGKSSVVNTMDSVFKGRISTVAEARQNSSAAASVTKQYRVYRPGGFNSEVCFNMCDTMGMEQEAGFQLDDLVYVLDGSIPDGFEFSRNRRITPDSHGFIRNPTVSQRIHCVAVVVNGMKVEHMNWYRINRISELASARKIALVILVTHVDQICPLVQRDVRMVHKSAAVEEVIAQVSGKTGINVNQVFPVQNYTKEIDNKPYIDVLMLTALRKMLDYADDNLEIALRTQ